MFKYTYAYYKGKCQLHNKSYKTKEIFKKAHVNDIHSKYLATCISVSRIHSLSGICLVFRETGTICNCMSRNNASDGLHSSYQL